MGVCKKHHIKWVDKPESTNECYRCVRDERNALLESTKDAYAMLSELHSIGTSLNPRMRWKIENMADRIGDTLRAIEGKCDETIPLPRR